MLSYVILRYITEVDEYWNPFLPILHPNFVYLYCDKCRSEVLARAVIRMQAQVR
eukprot:Awhi_evm1s8306